MDEGLIDAAQQEIYLAAYSLTDRAVIWALSRAAKRGVDVHILLDRGQHDQREETKWLTELRSAPGVEVRIKKSRMLMHLKAYEIDGQLLRTGSANFSPSGLKLQDNDIVVLRNPSAAHRFRARFEEAWARAAR